MIEHRNIILSGDTGSIDFCYYTELYAHRHGINGYIKRGDKTHIYYIEAEGEKENLDKFENHLVQAPLGNFVEAKDMQKGEVKDFYHFQIKKKQDPKKAPKFYKKLGEKIAALFNNLMFF